MLTRILQWLGFATGGVIDESSSFNSLLVDTRPPEEVQEKPMRKHTERIIAGMGSGDSSDVNTYAMADRLGMRKGTPLPRMKDRVTIETQEARSLSDALDVSAKPIDVNAIADAMDRAYTRDPETKKLVLKDNLPIPAPDPEGAPEK